MSYSLKYFFSNNKNGISFINWTTHQQTKSRILVSLSHQRLQKHCAFLSVTRPLKLLQTVTVATDQRLLVEMFVFFFSVTYILSYNCEKKIFLLKTI